MSDSEFIYAVHKITGLVSQVPRLWLSILPFRELAAKELADLREAAAAPAPANEVPAAPVEAPTVPEPAKEG